MRRVERTTESPFQSLIRAPRGSMRRWARWAGVGIGLLVLGGLELSPLDPFGLRTQLTSGSEPSDATTTSSVDGSGAPEGDASSADHQPLPSMDLGFLAPGAYRYDAAGSVSAGDGAVAIPDEIDVVVEAPIGDTQRVLRDEGGVLVDMVFRHSPHGIEVASLRLDLPGFEGEFSMTGSALTLPESPSRGQAWEWEATSISDDDVLTARLVVARGEQVTIDGSPIPTVVLHVALRIHGDVPVEIVETQWVALNGLVVQRRVDGTARTPEAPTRWNLHAVASSMEPT